MASTVQVKIVDCQAALSAGLLSHQGGHWELPHDEFEVPEPYLRAPLQSKPAKKRKTDKSVAEIQTDEQHAQARAFLLQCLDNIADQWPFGPLHDRRDRTDDTPFDLLSLFDMAKMIQSFKVDSNDHALTTLTSDLTLTDTLHLFYQCYTNPSPTCRILAVDQCRFIIPPGATFLMSDMHDMAEPMKALVEEQGRFQCIVMDPPWPNKSVHRSERYDTQDIYDLFALPMDAMMDSEQGLVAVWVTNKPKFKRFIKDKLFASWGLTCVGEWFWLKVTSFGEPVLPLDSPHRKPYEQLVLGAVKGSKAAQSVPYTHTIVSVPSRRHSRKPPLQDILTSYLPPSPAPRCLELFARCLLPGWTSWGNECLKFQQETYFEWCAEPKKGDPTPPLSASTTTTPYTTT